MVEGWTQADALIVGDVILNGDQQPLTLLVVVIDDTPQLLHNLEIAAHTRISRGSWMPVIVAGESELQMGDILALRLQMRCRIMMIMLKRVKLEPLLCDLVN